MSKASKNKNISGTILTIVGGNKRVYTFPKSISLMQYNDYRLNLL